MQQLEQKKSSSLKSKGGLSENEKRKIEDQFKAKQKELER